MATSSPKATASADVQATVKRLIDLGVLLELASGTVMPVNPYDRLPAAERYLLTGLNQTLLSQVLFPEALERSLAPAWVDPRLTTPKPWRDVYRYDEKTGALLGWRRHGSGKVALFDAEGRWLPQGLQHPEQAVPVTYEKNAAGHLEWKAALR